MDEEPFIFNGMGGGGEAGGIIGVGGTRTMTSEGGAAQKNCQSFSTTLALLSSSAVFVLLFAPLRSRSFRYNKCFSLVSDASLETQGQLVE